MNSHPGFKQETLNPFLYFNLQKASPEAIGALLDAMNAEVDEAVAENRIPTLEGAFKRLHPSSPSLQ